MIKYASTICFTFEIILLDSHSVSDLLDELDELESMEDDSNPDVVPALPIDIKHIPFQFSRIPIEDSEKRSQEFYDLMNKRRTVRFFSSDPVPKEIIHNIIRTAGITLLLLIFISRCISYFNP